MDFAPYQSSPPEHGRVLSPDHIASPRTSWESQPRRYSQASPPPLQHPQPQRAWSGDGIRSPTDIRYQASPAAQPRASEDYFGAVGAREAMVSEFDTSLGIRLDYEACLAYLVLPPVGAIVLLILERKSDYVRFHAWQASLLFTAMFVIHLLFSWSRFFSWVIFLGDLGLMGWLTMRAYRDADTLDRFEVPIVGRIASRILDDE